MAIIRDWQFHFQGTAISSGQCTLYNPENQILGNISLLYRFLYMLSCIFNTISMMCSSLLLVVVVLLPAATFVGRYHVMAIVILGAAVLG